MEIAATYLHELYEEIDALRYETEVLKNFLREHGYEWDEIKHIPVPIKD